MKLMIMTTILFFKHQDFFKWRLSIACRVIQHSQQNFSTIFRSLSAFKNTFRSCLMKDRKHNTTVEFLSQASSSFAATTFQIRTFKIGCGRKNVIPQTPLLFVFSEIQVLSQYLHLSFKELQVSAQRYLHQNY